MNWKTHILSRFVALGPVLAALRFSLDTSAQPCETSAMAGPKDGNSEIARLIDDRGGVQRAIDVLFENLDAVRGIRTGDGYAVVPDVKARHAAATVILAYRVGLPVQRQEVHTITYDGLKEIEARIAESGMQEKLEAALKGLPGAAALLAAPIEAEAEELPPEIPRKDDGKTADS